MAIQDRIERFSRIKAWLGYPKEQKPNPHQILNQMLVDEHWMNLKLTNEGESWNLIYKDLVTVAGQSEYTIAQPVSNDQQSGKVYFAVRATSDSDLPYLPVPFDDLSELDYGEMPTGMADSLAVPEKLSVYRTDMQDQTRKVVIQPTPQEALTYRIWFYTAQLDRLQAAMDKSGIVTELSDYLDLKSTLALLAYAEWYDADDPMKQLELNNRKAIAIGKGLEFQFNEHKPEVEQYINSINNPTSFDLDYWNQ